MTEKTGNKPGLLSKLQLMVLVALAYLLLGIAGLSLAIPPGYASPVFPAAGFALACTVWFGFRVLPAVWLGSALLNLWHVWLRGNLDPTTAALAAVIAAGAAAQAWAGFWLVNRWLGSAWRQMEREQDAFGFLFVGGVIAGFLASTISVIGLEATRVIEGTGFLFTWWNWYVGDVLGILIFAPLTLSLLDRQSDIWRERRRRILLPMLLTFALVVAAFYGASRWEQQVQDRQLYKDCERIEDLIDKEMISQRKVLSSLRHFIEATPNFTFKQFEQFTRSTLQDNPDIFALSYNDLVTEGERPSFEQMMSALSPLGSYQITERDSQNRLRRATFRPEYVPVRYIVPLDSNRPAVGFDIYSEPVRRDTIERARSLNSMAVTAPIRLVQEQQSRIGVLEILPVYGLPKGVRGENLLSGFAVAVIKVDEMINIATRGQVPTGFIFQLLDPKAASGHELLYNSNPAGAAKLPPSQPVRWKTTLRMADRDWEMLVYTNESYHQLQRQWIAWAVGFVGLLFAALLQILMLGMTGRTAVIQRKNEALKSGEEALRNLNINLERKVEERTAELAAAQIQTEEALMRVTKSEALFRAMIEQAPLGVALTDSITGQLYEVNENFTRIVGRPREELNSCDWTQITHPEDVQALKEKIALLNAGKTSYFQMDTRYIRPDGAKIWTNMIMAPVIIEAGRNPLHLAMLEDITERKETDERLRCITDSAYDAIIMMNPEGAISYWNPAAAEIMGYSGEEALGKNLHELLVPERYLSDFRAAFPEFVRTGRGNALGKTLESFAKHKDGREIPVAISLSAVLLQGAWHAVGIVRDITQQREFEEGLQAAKLAAEKATLAKSEFLASMSHEIRTPMNAVIGMAELLSETDLSREQKKYVEVCKSAGETLLTIINDILDISKAEAGQIQLENIAFDLVQNIESLCEIMAGRAQQKGLELACRILPDVPTLLQGDSSRLRQVLMNLIGNAIKFTEHGQVMVEVKQNATMPEPSANSAVGECLLQFSVSDTGIGIPPEKKELIFERFSQADTSITRKYGGTGLGLAISQSLVRLMGGTIQVDSKVNEGSTFSFTAKFGVQKKSEDKFTPDSHFISGKRVLIIDDNSTNRLILKEMLAQLGALAVEAEDGERGISEVKRARDAGEPYDLALLDRHMPGLDGFQVAEALKQDPSLKCMAVMMYSSEDRSKDILRSQMLGVQSYLVKPVKRADLREAIMQALGKIETNKRQDKEFSSADFQNLSPLRILLVEDFEDNRMIIKVYLKGTQYQLDIAENGQIAVEKFVAGKYDLILMDIGMPVMDGYTATREIRKIENQKGMKPVPILALTAYALKEEIQKSLDAGCNAHLTKPIKKAALFEAINRYAG